MATNIASYVGHEQVWTYVKGYEQTPATASELADMQRLIAQAMEEGALGLSTSLLMPPSSVATTANLTELAAVARRYGGIYSTHIRDEGEGVFARDCRSHPGGRRRAHPGGHHPHEDRAPETVGPRIGDRRDGRKGPRRWPGRPRERLSVHRRAEQPVLHRPAMGPRRRTREADGAPARPCGPPAAAHRGARGAPRLVQPLPGDR